MIRRHLLAAAAFACLPGIGSTPVTAADLEAELLIPSPRVVFGEEFPLTVEVRGQEAGDASPPDLFALKEVRVLGYPSVHSRYQWQNGRASFTKSFRYTMMPERAGTLAIGPVRVQVGERVVVAPAIRMEVIGGPAAGGTGAAPAPPRSDSGPPPGGVRAIAAVDKKRVYLGEPVLLEFRIESPHEVRALELVEQPEFPGFWVEEIPPQPDKNIRRVRRQGSAYIEYTVMKRALFPGRSGTLVIEPVIFAVTVPRAKTDPFRSFLFESRQTLHRRTDRIEVEVLPLPERNRPENFRGAVGTYRLEVHADRTRLPVHEAVTLRITVQGRGNLGTLESPTLETPEEIRPYDPRVVKNWEAGEEGLRGRKTWEYVLVPRAAGRHTIPPVQLSYFDPERAAYRTLSSHPVVLEVEPGDDLSGDAGAGRGPLVARGRDIRYIRNVPAEGLRHRSRPLYLHPITVLAILLPALGNGYLFSVRRWRRNATLHGPARRRRQAGRRARQALRKIGSSGSATDAAARILSEYVTDTFDQSAAGLTRGAMEELLRGTGIPGDLARRVGDFLAACDAARFGGEAVGRRDSIIETARQLLDRLEAHK